MKQIHFVINRINPSLKIDSIRIGELVDGRFSPVNLEVFSGQAFYPLVMNSEISDTSYVLHSKIPALLSDLSVRDGFSLDFFDNTMVLIANFNLDTDESSSKEENQRH